MDRDYDRARFAYLAAAVSEVCAAGVVAYRGHWLFLPVCAVLLGFTIWRARTVLARIRGRQR